MRVPSGRRLAVAVVLVATVAFIAGSAPGPTLATDPPGLDRFMKAMGQVESGGNYAARNPVSGAYGKYQIMPANWPAWARRYLGDANAQPTPANQEIVAAGKMRSLYRGLDSWQRVAYWWLTGSSQATGWSDRATRYVDKVMTIYERTPSATPNAKPTPQPARTGATTTALRRFAETSPSIAYSGTWRSAAHRGYAGDAVRYATAAGAKASLTFTGRRVTWYGPVGPTRGKARVFVDGKFVTVVDLHRSAFVARTAVFSRAWAKAGKHTLTIEVVGTASRPYVAIDELAVAS